jgi:molybdenum cofactor guanylyltransferase
MPNRPAGVILAGGKSSRMGSERKSLSLLNGETMLSRVIERLKPQVSQVLLSCEPGDEALSGFDLPLVEDALSRYRGPLTGLYSALRFLPVAQREQGLMLCPCDAPFIPEDLVERLLAAAKGNIKPVAVVSYEGILQPTFSLWQGHHLLAVEEAVVAREQGGLKHMLYALPHVVVEWPTVAPPPFYNINTPEDLSKASAWLVS